MSENKVPNPTIYHHLPLCSRAIILDVWTNPSIHQLKITSPGAAKSGNQIISLEATANCAPKLLDIVNGWSFFITTITDLLLGNSWRKPFYCLALLGRPAHFPIWFPGLTRHLRNPDIDALRAEIACEEHIRLALGELWPPWKQWFHH